MAQPLSSDLRMRIIEAVADDGICRRAAAECCVAAIPHGHCKTTTFVGALRPAGTTASMVLDGAVDGLAFEAYVRDVPASTLSPGDVVVMDNLPAHERTEIRDPIAMAFSKLEAMLRKAAARSVEALSAAIATALAAITPTECVNFFAAAGYDRV